MSIHENGFVNKLIQQEALVIKKKQFDTGYLSNVRTNAIMFYKNCVFYSSITPVFHPAEIALGNTLPGGFAYFGNVIYTGYFKPDPDYKNPDSSTR